MAGGPSKLPFMRQQIETALRHYGVERNDIYIGDDPGNAVAFGIAAECRERVSRNPKLGTGRIAPSLITDIFFAFKKDRHRQSKFYIPNKAKNSGKLFENGQLISSPFELPESKLTFDMEFPFPVNDNLYYYFSTTPFGDSHKEDILNLNDFSVSISHLNKVIKKFQLELVVSDGAIKPTFQVKEKRSARTQGFIPIEGNEFFLDESNIKEGDSFLGVDFGTSNSYLARFINQQHHITTAEYPEFKVTNQVARKLIAIENEYKENYKDELFSNENIKEFLRNKKCLHVYQSNKIEGNPLSKGETEELILQTSSNGFTLPKREATNLANAFDWALENLDFCMERPGQFIRQLHKLVLDNIKPDAGEYRKGPVKLSCMDFEPPSSGSVSAFMGQLQEEIQEGCKGRSIIEFACTIHTKFVFIHPFADGNGRTARLLMNALLWVHNSPGIIVNAVDKPRYLDALSISNDGDLSPLLSFFIDGYRKEYTEFVDAFKLPDNSKKKTDTKLIGTTGSININHIDDESIDDIDPIEEALRRKYIIIKESYKKSLLEVKDCFSELTEEFEKISNSTSEYKSFETLGYKISTTRFSSIDLDTYCDLVTDKKTLPVWSFKFEMSHNNDHVCLLFSYDKSSDKVSQSLSICF